MICKRCPEGRRYANGSTICRFYGMIIRDEHECTLKRGQEHERNNNYRHEGYDGPAVRDNGGWFAGGVPEILAGPEEPGGIPEGGEA